MAVFDRSRWYPLYRTITMVLPDIVEKTGGSDTFLMAACQEGI